MNEWMNVSCAFSAIAWVSVLNEPSTRISNADTHLTSSSFTTQEPHYSLSLPGVHLHLPYTFRLRQKSNQWSVLQPGHFLLPRFCLISVCSPLLVPPLPAPHPSTPCVQGLSNQNPLWFLLEPSFMVCTKQTLNRWQQIMSSLFILAVRFLICLVDMNGKHSWLVSRKKCFPLPIMGLPPPMFRNVSHQRTTHQWSAVSLEHYSKKKCGSKHSIGCEPGQENC